MGRPSPLEKIFFAALEKSTPPERDAYLTEACADDSDLRDRVERMLAAQMEAGSFLEIPAQETDLTLNFAPLSERPGTVIGPYKLLQEIGRGGMGVVYEAEDITLGRRVALKILPFAALLNQKQLQRFDTEVTAAARLQHPGIVAIYSVGCARGIHFYAMQLIDGPSLADVIAQMQNKRHPGEQQQLAETAAAGRADVLTRDEDGSHYRAVARIGKVAAEALHYAHENGVLHRDIKPSNLLLDKTGRVWIADFGLARVDNESDLTRTGDILGTLRYMSPEQATGDRVDARTDIYSLGATLYELSTLHPAFDAEDRRDLIRQVIAGNPTAPHKVDSRIPKQLSLVISKSMARLDDRYQSARELAEDLRRYLDGEAVLARPPSSLRRATAALRRHPMITISSIALLICFGFLIIQSSRTYLTAWLLRPQVTRKLGPEEMSREAPERGSTRGARARSKRSERSESPQRNGFRHLLHEPLEDRRLLATGSISGTVFEDLDADGAQDVGEAGMAGKTIVLGRRAPLLTVTDPTPQVSEKFGFVIAATETSLVVSNQFDDAAGDHTGSVFVFDIKTGALTTTIPNPSPDYDDHFGQGMAASNSRLVIGAPWDDTDGLQSGIAYLYDLIGNKLAEFHNPNPAGPLNSDWFGLHSTGAGNNVVICSPGEDFAGQEDSGVAYLFDTSGGLLATIENPSPDAYDSFGSAVASSGSEIFISAPWDDTLGTNAGTVYVFDGAGEFTGRVIENPAPGVDGEGDRFGSRITATENQLLVAAWTADQGATDAGAVYLFDAATGNLLQTFVNPSPDAADLFGSAISFVDGWVAIGARAEDAHATNGGIVYLFDPDTGDLIHTLVESVPTDEAYFGRHMASVGNTLWVSATRPESGAGGAAYAFKSPEIAETDGSGNYRFGDVGAGTYAVYSSPPKGLIQTRPSGDGTHSVTVGPGEHRAGLDFAYRLEPVLLFADSFENGQWNGNWVEDAQDDWSTTSRRSTDGNYSAEVDGPAEDATLTSRPIDTTPYGCAELKFDWLIEPGFDAGEFLAVDISPDGLDWTEITRLSGDVDPENSWIQQTIEVAPGFLTDAFQVRFRALVDSHEEAANVDNVQLWATCLTGPPNELPIARAGGPYAGQEGSVVALDGSASSDPDGTIVAYAWDLDNDGQFDDATGATATFSATVDGTFTIGLRVTDDAGGSATETTSVTVSNVAPTADAGGPYTVEEAVELTLDASASWDPGGDIVLYEWDLDNDGDFNDAVGVTTSHTWVDPGDYNVRVRVTDDTVSDVSTATVKVTAVNSPPVAEAGGPYFGDEGSAISARCLLLD
jgi:serine/threonine protein kinase